MVTEYDDVKGSVWFWFLTVTISVCIILTVINCLCGCRKKIPKNELLGLAGLVKITNPDENVNFNSCPPEIQLNSITVSTDELTNEIHDPSKRGSNAIATATRSLPDLPVDLCEPLEKLWPLAENNTDTNSDLYATVEDANRKKRPLTSGLTVDSSYTPSQTDDSLSPYARLKGEHPYDQLEQNEHPYAQVGSNGVVAGPSTAQDTPVNSTSSRGVVEVEQEDERKSTSESGEETIPAASAIAGSVPANHDLPYMTPPIPAGQQQHFSGDSVDSSKGYTSISVREPLSCILNEARQNNSVNNNNVNNNSNTQDPHYATVSDDSDEMYAAIEERQGGEYTSGSETYARITPRQALTLAIHHPPPPPAATSHTGHHHHSHHLHKRESASSLSSSESPRRERRVANSPLPQVPPTLDDMYAKVMKKGRSPTSPEPPSPSIMSLPPPSPPILHDDIFGISGIVNDHRPGSSGNGGNDDEGGADTYESLDPVTDPNYEEVAGAGGSSSEPDYASLLRRYDPPYERVTTSMMVEDDIIDQPDYEVVSTVPGGGPLSQIYSQIEKNSPEKDA